MRTIETIIAIIDHIEARLDAPLTLGRLEKKLGYSRYHLHHLFTRTVGLPIHAYIQRRRLTEAARRLVDSKRPIVEIALQSGYGSQQAFTTVFSDMYKLPPGRFRRERSFYPLQMRFEFGGPVPGTGSGACGPVGTQPIMPACVSDAAAWMSLVRLTVDGFPCLDEAEHVATLMRYIASRRAFIMKERETAIGIMMLSPRTGSIDFLGVHPFYRHGGIIQAHIAKAVQEMASHGSVSITTYRQGDRADTGHRRTLKALGFVEGQLLLEFGYPTQKMILPANRAR